jgi:Mn2+/Fe2+ NRAMP family transporter
MGPFAFVAFPLGTVGTGLLAVPILSGSAAYALKEFFGLKGDLCSKPAYRPTFYAVICAADTDKYRLLVSRGRLHSPADYADSCAGVS